MTPRRVYTAALAAAIAASAIVLIVLGRREFIGYDSYWHVFIARQDRWPNFWQEVRDNAHPPLFYFCLRAASAWFGSNLLAYRAVSIAATAVATGLVGGIVRRTTSSRALAIVAAAAYGLSYGVIVTGLEVRAYALCAAFALLAFLFYLDWLAPARRLSNRTCAGFALAATAAVLTHYSTFFFLAGALATPVVLAAVDRRWRRRLSTRIAARPLATAWMFGTPTIVAAAAYVIHVALWGGGRISHVPDNMLDPATETAWRFLLRNTINLAGIALPGGNEFIAGIYNSVQVAALVVLGGVSLIGLISLGRPRTPRLAAVPIVWLGVMVALNAIGGLARRYPYGGAARHEFFLVPFALVGFFSLIEVVRRAVPRPFNRRAIWVAAAACGVVGSIVSWTSMFRVDTQALFQPQMTHFRALIPSPRAVLVDQFSFINLFSHYHDWQWRLGGQWKGHDVWQVWQVTKDGSRFVVCRDAQWSLDMSAVATFDGVVGCGVRSGVGRVAVFRTHWWDAPPKLAAVDRTLARDDGLTSEVIAADGNDVYAEFAIDPAVLHECSGPPSRPTDLRVVANSGRVVVLAWAPSDGRRTSYILEAGRGSGGTDAANMPLGRTTTYTVGGVMPGTYYARIRAKNVCYVSEPSDEIKVTVK